jgi:predicted PurR-regulated permease PerM
MHSSYDNVAHFSWRFLVCLGAFFAALLVLTTLSSVTIPIVVALLLCSATTPLVRRLQKTGMKPAAAAGIATLGVIALFVVLGLILVLTVLRQWDDLVASLQNALNEFRAWLQSVPGLPAGLEEWASQDSASTVRAVAPVLLGGSVRFVSVVATLVGESLLALLLMFYFLVDGGNMWNWLLRQSGHPDDGRVDRTARRCWKNVEGYMLGTLIVGACDGVVIGTGLRLLGVPNALALGVLFTFAEFIPLIGPTVIGTVAVLLAYGHGGFEAAFLAFLVIWPIQQINGHVTAPYIYGRTIQLNPVVVLLAIMVGGIMGGLLGMLIAVPVAGVLGVILAELRPSSVPNSLSADGVATAGAVPVEGDGNRR